MTFNLNNIPLFDQLKIASQLDTESLKQLRLVDQKLRELVENHSYLKITYQLNKMCPTHIFLQLLHYADFHDEAKKTSQLVLSTFKTCNVKVEEVDAVSQWILPYLQCVVECAKLPSGTFTPAFGVNDNRGVLYQTVDVFGSIIYTVRAIQAKYPNHTISLNPYVTFSDTGGASSLNWYLIDGQPLSEYEAKAQS